METVSYSTINHHFRKGLGVGGWGLGGNSAGFGLSITWCQYQYRSETSPELTALKLYNYINNIALIYSCLWGTGFIESGPLVMLLLQTSIDLISFHCTVKGNVKHPMIILQQKIIRI